jgi:hypothetical protein
MSMLAMRILGWMCSNTRKDLIRNELVHENVELAPIEDNMMSSRLR